MTDQNETHEAMAFERVLKNGGGPAFPFTINLASGGKVTPYGLTARDYFAGRALTGLLMAQGAVVAAAGVTQGELTDQFTAERAYELADAMLAERDRIEEEGT